MRILVVAEHEENSLRQGSLSALRFAAEISSDQQAEIFLLILGDQLDQLATEVAKYSSVLLVDSLALAEVTADRYAEVIAQVVKQQQADYLIAASTSFAKDVVTRAAGLLGGAMASEVVAHYLQDDQRVLQRPMYAGAVMADVVLHGTPKIITIRASSFPPAEPLASVAEITNVEIDTTSLPDQIHIEQTVSKSGDRPDLTEATVVVSGGRALKNSDDFERLVGGLADALGGAAGSSRVLVDNGITPNELQVGQTGKIVAPDLYIALGISGAVQHLAGMKNSKVIVAVNQDSDAPIFEIADYGILGDVYEVVPQMIEKLKDFN